MKQVNIKKLGNITNSASFESDAELQNWLDYHILINSFGRPAVYENRLDENGEVETVLVTPAEEYSVEIIDISSQIEQEQINAESQAFLAATDWKILRHIRQNALGELPTLSEEEYLALEAERSAKAALIVK